MNKSININGLRFNLIHEVQQTLSVNMPRWRKELLHLSALIRLWRWRHKQRRELAQLSDFMLKDIGVSRVDAQQEAKKPFWKA